MSKPVNSIRVTIRSCIFVLALTTPLLPPVTHAYQIPSTALITNTLTLNGTERALIIPNPNSVWNVWGPVRGALGYGGLTGTPGHGAPIYPAPNNNQGALLLYLNNQVKHIFLPSERAVYLRGPGTIGFGPNDNKLSGNVGSIEVPIIINPETPTLSQYSPTSL
jgi:hypothetical protein